MIKVDEIPRPYSARLSKTTPEMEIVLDGEALLFIPLTMPMTSRTAILNALNGAFMEGVLYANKL